MTAASSLLIPPGLSFQDLDLRTDGQTGQFEFSPGPMETFCRHNQLDPALVLGSNLRSTWVVSAWYCRHRMLGGAPDAVADEAFVDIAARYRTGDLPAPTPLNPARGDAAVPAYTGTPLHFRMVGLTRRH